jgi:hypothetical protein
MSRTGTTQKTVSTPPGHTTPTLARGPVLPYPVAFPRLRPVRQAETAPRPQRPEVDDERV